jgi:dTDP-4-amino-4,6-dideoxygalactose transaminase
MIHFNRPCVTGKEIEYIQQAIASCELSGNRVFTKKCQSFFENKYGFHKCLLTTSGTDALEMAALLCNVEVGDEVIVPSYTFVSSALAFVRQGAKIVFADSMANHPNIDVDKLEALITDKTKVIVVVHYAGVACDMDRVMDIAHRHNVLVVEDAAQAIDAYYKGRPLGSIGDFGCFSFHETKNVTAGGEGGMLTVNHDAYVRRAEIMWEKGTNRAEFYRGMVNKYGWVDTGSSFLPAEINSAYLWAQLENLDAIQKRRTDIWNRYNSELQELEDKGFVKLPELPNYATNNGHMFYMICRSFEERTAFISFMKEHDVLAVFHYLSLHLSQYYKEHSDTIPQLPNSDHFADHLVRLPLYYALTDSEVDHIVSLIKEFYSTKK